MAGLGPYMLIGRTRDYAWSLTSAGNDNQDVFAERLCVPGKGKPTRSTRSYLYKGKCRAMRIFDAGKLGNQRDHLPPDRPRPRRRNRDGARQALRACPQALDLRPGRRLARSAQGDDRRPGDHAKRFWKYANRFGFTFNWAYTSRRATAFFSSGRLPVRARGLDRRLPTLGTGAYEWRGYLSRERPSPRPRWPARPAAQLEQQARARLHGRRRRALRLGPARGALQPVPEAPADQQRRRRHEQRRRRGPERLPRLARDPRHAATHGAPDARTRARSRSSTRGDTGAHPCWASPRAAPSPTRAPPSSARRGRGSSTR